MTMTNFIMERISQTLFSSGKLTVSIYELLNDKGSNDGRAYPSNQLNLYSSTKYTNAQVLGEFTFGRSNVILGFSYTDRSVTPMVRESVNFGEEFLMISNEFQTLREFAAHMVANYQTIYVAGVNGAVTINQQAVPSFEIKNNKGLRIGFVPAVVNRIMDNMTVPVPGMQIIIGNYSELITFDQFSYLVSQVMLYMTPESLAALKNVFKLTTIITGQYRVSEPRSGGFAGGGYANYGQTRGQFNTNVNGGQFGGGSTPNFAPQGQNFGGGVQQQTQFNAGGYQQPQFNNFQQQSGGAPNFQNADNPFMGNPEEVGSNPFAAEGAPAGNTRFRRATTQPTAEANPQPNPTPVGGNLNIDTTATVERTDLETLATDMNGTPAEDQPVTEGNLNASILAATENLAAEAEPTDAELEAVLGDIQ